MLATVYRFVDGQIESFNFAGQKLKTLSGLATPRLEIQIRLSSNDRTKFHGFPPGPALVRKVKK